MKYQIKWWDRFRQEGGVFLDRYGKPMVFSRLDVEAEMDTVRDTFDWGRMTYWIEPFYDDAKDDKLPAAVVAERVLIRHLAEVRRSCGLDAETDFYEEVSGLLVAAINEAINVAVAEVMAGIPSSVLE